MAKHHPLVEILDDIQEEYELDLETTREESDITRLIDRREARKVAAFEARDMAVAKAVRYACEDVADSEREAIQMAQAEYWARQGMITDYEFRAYKLVATWCSPRFGGALDLNEIIKGVK